MPDNFTRTTGFDPNVMVSSTNSAFNLTVNNAASGHYALVVMTIVAVLLMPVVLAYQGWSFHVFRARVGGAPTPAAPSAPVEPAGPAPVEPAAPQRARRFNWSGYYGGTAPLGATGSTAIGRVSSSGAALR